MLAALLLFISLPIEQKTADALTQWKLCVFDKAKLYESTKESVGKVAELALNSCDAFDKEFLKLAIAQFSAIPSAKPLWAVNEAAKSRNELRERMRRDVEVMVADIRVGIAAAAKE